METLTCDEFKVAELEGCIVTKMTTRDVTELRGVTGNLSSRLSLVWRQ
jgi:hypothetical protein